MANLFSDLGGVVYSFDQTLDPQKHQLEFNRIIESAQLDGSDTKLLLEAEWTAIIKGELKIYPIASAIQNLIKNMELYKLIIVSTSLTKTSRLIMETLGIPTVGVEFYDISDYGSKKDPQSWAQIFKQYTHVDILVEDDPQNLLVAANAAYELGFKPESHLAMPLLTK